MKKSYFLKHFHLFLKIHSKRIAEPYALVRYALQVVRGHFEVSPYTELAQMADHLQLIGMITRSNKNWDTELNGPA